MLVDCDLHMHSKYSAATSGDMELKVMAEQAKLKGLGILGTSDCLHPDWLESIKELERVDEGTFEWEGTRFVLTVEVEDSDRVHHLLVFPSLSSVSDFRASISNFSPNIDQDGRPHVKLKGEAIARIASDVGALIGPAHAFTPWTAVYKSFHSLEACYGSMWESISFLELGLSADSYFADQISSLAPLTFLSNSDAHSPYPHRMGREFNRLEVKSATFSEVEKAIKRKSGRRVALNVGLDPREGKYHCTACRKCHQKYSLDEAKHFRWKCVKCGKSIKKGVKDRIAELADQFSSPPSHRPEYVHIFPLPIIIQKTLGLSSPTLKTVQEIYSAMVPDKGTETEVLLDVPIDSLFSGGPDIEKVAESIKKFREGEVVIVPGGGGKYGELIIPNDRAELKRIVKERSNELNCVSGLKQRTLSDFHSSAASKSSSKLSTS